jgi:hypothetical protein
LEIKPQIELVEEEVGTIKMEIQVRIIEMEIQVRIA